LLCCQLPVPLLLVIAVLTHNSAAITAVSEKIAVTAIATAAVAVEVTAAETTRRRCDRGTGGGGRGLCIMLCDWRRPRDRGCPPAAGGTSA
jgi:hypothetical protein